MAWRSLMQAQVRVLAQIRDALRPLGLSISDFDVLVNIDPGEALRHSTLAGRVVLSSTGLTRLVDRLSGRGLLQREEAPEDGRGVVISLTAQGIELRDEAIRLNGEAVHRAMQFLSDDQVELLGAATQAMGRGTTTQPRRGG